MTRSETSVHSCEMVVRRSGAPRNLSGLREVVDAERARAGGGVPAGFGVVVIGPDDFEVGAPTQPGELVASAGALVRTAGREVDAPIVGHSLGRGSHVRCREHEVIDHPASLHHGDEGVVRAFVTGQTVWMSNVAFLGLGVMGAPMARHLSAAGHTVTVYNRTPEKALAWVALYGNRAAPTPKEAAEGAEFVFMCVGNDNDVRDVVYGPDGALAGAEAGAVLVDHTTASAQVARELAEACMEFGVGFVDAPVSGGQAGAEKGQLTIMCGTDDEAFYGLSQPVMASYATATALMGSAGAGQLTKMVNQILIAGIVQGLSEGLNFAVRAGLDPERVTEVIKHGAAQSWQLENRGQTMVKGQFDFGFAVEWMRKDLGIVLDEANRNGARLPVTALIDQFYGQVIARGGTRWDTSSLIHLLAND